MNLTYKKEHKIVTSLNMKVMFDFHQSRLYIKNKVFDEKKNLLLVFKINLETFYKIKDKFYFNFKLVILNNFSDETNT